MKNVTVILVAILALIVGVYAWLGGFAKITVLEEKAGPFHLLYLEHKGPYKNVGEVVKKVQALVDQNSIKPSDWFGAYYDNPAAVESEKLRSSVGCIVDDENLKKAAAVVKEGKLLQRDIGEQTFVKTTFPKKNMLSIMIGIGKVYPALDKYAKDHNFPQSSYKEKNYQDNYIMEIYHEKSIEYLMTLPAK